MQTEYHQAVTYFDRINFPKIVDALPSPVKETFKNYLAQRAIVTKLDYKLACTLRDRVAQKSGGEQTDVLLSECLKEAMANPVKNSMPTKKCPNGFCLFRNYFDAAWQKRLPKQKAIDRKSISAQSFKDYCELGKTYVARRNLGSKGWIHLKPGHT